MSTADPNVEEIKNILRQSKELAARYYALTGKPLGLAGEVAELEAAEKIGLVLAPARTPGYDAMIGDLRVQIKGRAVDPAKRYRGRVPAIKGNDAFDVVHLVLLDRATLDAIEIWEASEQDVLDRLDQPGSKARNERRQMGISQFKSISKKIWSA